MGIYEGLLAGGLSEDESEGVGTPREGGRGGSSDGGVRR